MMNELFHDLRKTITNGKSRELVETEIARNIQEAVCIPELYELGLEILSEIFDKSDSIDSRFIPTIVNSGYKQFGIGASVLLPHIKCSSFNKLSKLNKTINDENEKEVKVEVEKEIENILGAMEFIPIIGEVKKAFHDVIEWYRSALKRRVCQNEDEEDGIDIDWESEYNKMKAKYELLEQKVSNTKLLWNRKEVKERKIEGEEREKLKRVIERRKVKELIEALSSDPSLIDGDVVHMCAESGWKEGIEAVLDFCFLEDEYLEKKDISGGTPLMIAAGRGQLEVVKYLIEKGSNIEVKEKNESTSLMIATANGLLDIVKYLISKGANVEAKDKYGYTPLMVASKDGQLEVVKYLIEKGANIEMKSKYENTALILASMNGHFDIAKYLIEKGVNIEERNKYEETALMVASRNGQLEVVKYLIEKGANIEAHDNNGFTSLTLANIFDRLEVVEYLESIH